MKKSKGMKIKQDWQPLRNMFNYLLLLCPISFLAFLLICSPLFACLYPFLHLLESKLLRSFQFWPLQVLPTQYKVCCTDSCPGLLLSSQHLCLAPLLQYISVTSLVFNDKILYDPGLLCVVFLAQLISNPILAPQMTSVLMTYLRFVFHFHVSVFSIEPPP